MTKRAKFLTSLTIVALTTAAALAHKHAFEKDDEDEEAIELVEKAQAQEAGVNASCGVERWAVKTLSDSKAGSVNFTPVDAGVGQLANSPVGSPWTGFNTPAAAKGPYKMPPDVRTSGGSYSEMQAYRVRGTLVRYKLENDRDYHLVLADPQTGETIIVESVDPGCPGANSSAYRQAFQNVRDQFLSKFSPPDPMNFTEIGNVQVTVVGVRFFDPLHKQNGVAQNGVELHPLLCFSTGSDCDK